MDSTCKHCGRLTLQCPSVRACTCEELPRPMCNSRLSHNSPCLSCIKYRYKWLVLIFVALIALPLLQHIMWRAHMKPISEESRLVNLYLMTGVLIINILLAANLVRTFDARQAVKYHFYER